MAAAKTKPTAVSVSAFINAVPDEERRRDSRTLLKMMKKATKAEPKMWGPTIIGFGSYHYKYASGHEGDMCITGFSPRKAAFSIYVLGDIEGQAGLLKKLGKHQAGKACLYIKRLSDIDLEVLEELVTRSVKSVKVKWS